MRVDYDRRAGSSAATRRLAASSIAEWRTALGPLLSPSPALLVDVGSRAGGFAAVAAPILLVLRRPGGAAAR